MNRLLKNIAYLSAVKGVDLVVPLLVMPYVIRVLGLEQYGIFSLALLYFNFLISFTDFGQSLIAIKDIAKTSDKKSKVSAVSQCLSIRLTLSLFIVVVTLSFTYISYYEYFWVVVAFSLGLLFEAFSLSFFFQAEQEMKKISLIQLSSRLISTIPIFIFINDGDDLQTYCFLHISPYVISSILVFFLFKKKVGIVEKYAFHISVPKLSSGWNIYSYQMINGLILPITSTFLAIGYDVKVVAIFAVIQRILSSVYRVFEPSVVAIYPYLASLYKQDYAQFKSRAKQVQILFFLSLGISVFVLNFFSNTIQSFIVGHGFHGDSDSLYKVMMFVLIPMVVNLLTTRMMVIIGLEGAISKVLIFTTSLILVSLGIVYYEGLAVTFIGLSLLGGYTLSMLLILWLFHNGINDEK